MSYIIGYIIGNRGRRGDTWDLVCTNSYAASVELASVAMLRNSGEFDQVKETRSTIAS